MMAAAWEARLPPSESEQTPLLIIRDSTGVATDCTDRPALRTRAGHVAWQQTAACRV
jgi:hypothetical protein